MANTNTRLDKIERQVKPKTEQVVICEDPNNKGVFYDRPWHDPERVQIDPAEVERLRHDPNALFILYVDDWRGPGKGFKNG